MRCYPWCGQRCSDKPAALPPPEFVPAGGLTQQHILVYPVGQPDEARAPTEVVVRDYFTYPPSYRSKNRLPERIPLSDDFLRLAGYFLAEGSIESGGRRTVFCFHRDEHRYAAEVKRAVRLVFGLRCDDRMDGRSRKVGVNSVIVAALMTGLFGRRQPERRIPPSWMALSTERLRHLVRAFLNGDGHRRVEQVCTGISSQTLIYQLRDILVRVGLVPSIREVTGGPCVIRRRVTTKNTTHELHVYHRLRGDRRGRRGWNDGQYVYLPVKHVSTDHHDGLVHNLQVAEDASYVVGSHAVHNCAYCDEAYSFYPYELILPVTSDDVVVAHDITEMPAVEGRLVAGFDVGRKRDLSELSIFEEVDGRQVCRLLRSYDQVPFAEQEAELRRLLNTLPLARLSIDQNGIGMHLAENLRRDFAQVVPETFTNESKEIWANDFRILLERKAVALPKDRELVAQLHSIKRRLTPSGRPSFEVEQDEVAKGHADRAWSVILACRKERGSGPGDVIEVGVRVIG